jgi:hypothetical protein
MYGQNMLYWGDLVNGVPDGVGFCASPPSAENGYRCQGQFINGKRHGRGAWARSDGFSYDGEFFQDKKHGRGIQREPSGAYYEGE